MQNSSANDVHLPLLRRSRKAQILVASTALVITHTIAFYSGVEYMRAAVLSELGAWGEQVEQNINNMFPEPEAEPQSFTQQSAKQSEDYVSVSRADLDTPSEFCWQGESCESATHPGVFYVHTTREGGPAVWPLPDADGCEANAGYVCTDDATGFMYSYWKGMYSWYSPQAEAMGLEPYGEQFMSDTAGLAQ
jgi:hypothetical protein